MNARQLERYWAIIPAAGTGVRMGANIPKQYLQLHGKSILEHTIDVVSAHPAIEKVIVVLHAEDHYWQQCHHVHSSKMITVIGGSTRAHSVMLGLECIQNLTQAHDWVLVHDAVRPCLTPQQLGDFIRALHKHTVGGLLGLPMADTLKCVDDTGHVTGTLKRDHLWCAQTPQMFRFELLYLALSQALLANRPVTDEASAIEMMDLSPQVIMGDSRNIKITFPSDLELAKLLIEQKS